MSSGPGNILIRIGAETASAVRGIGNVDKALGDSMTAGQKATAGLHKAALPAAAALTAIAAGAISAGKAAAEDAAAQERLAGQLSRTTGATDKQVAAAEDYITALSRQTGVADDELRPALGKLATATGDMTSAQKSLQVAMDVSSQTGKSLDSVSTAIAKGYAGQTASLGKLVPGLDQATLKSKDMTKVMGELSDLTGGAAADHAATAAGEYEVLTNQMNELKEGLGAGLLPIMQSFLPILQSAADFAAKNTKAIQILVGVVAALAGGILIANGVLKAYQAVQTLVKVATAAWTAAQWLLNAALDANPIGLVIIAVAALAAGIVIAYKNSQTFRDICASAFNIVKAAVDGLAGAFRSLLAIATSAFNFVKAHWAVAQFAFGPIAVALTAIVNNFDAIKDAAAAAFGAITSGIAAVTGAIQSAIGWVDRLLGKISSIHIPHLPFGLAAVSSPAIATTGLTRSRAGGAVATGGAAGMTFNIYGAVDPEGTARAISRIMRAHDRRHGRA